MHLHRTSFYWINKADEYEVYLATYNVDGPMELLANFPDVTNSEEEVKYLELLDSRISICIYRYVRMVAMAYRNSIMDEGSSKHPYIQHTSTCEGPLLSTCYGKNIHGQARKMIEWSKLTSKNSTQVYCWNVNLLFYYYTHFQLNSG